MTRMLLNCAEYLLSEVVHLVQLHQALIFSVDALVRDQTGGRDLRENLSS